MKLFPYVSLILAQIIALDSANIRAQSADIDLFIGEEGGQSNAYENTGTVNSPSWTSHPSWNPPDPGTRSTPAFGDVDDDGDYDLLIGISNGQTKGYENTGTGLSPAWVANTAWNIGDIGSEAAPWLADLDKDGDLDLVLGADDGVSHAYENTGAASSPTWTAKPSWDSPDAGNESEPLLVDLDKDGDLDQLIGVSTGATLAYENTGSAFSPTWTRRASWDVLDIGSDAAPAVGDLDLDGDKDLLMGANDGKSYGVKNIGSATSPSWALEPSWDAPDIGSNASPVLLDLDENGALLPVEMMSFDAELAEDAVEISWITAQELDADFFTLWRSNGGDDWEAITQVLASNTFEPSSYSYSDRQPVTATTYYRLQQTDYDGRSVFLGIAAVTPKSEVNVTVISGTPGSVPSLSLQSDVDAVIRLAIFTTTGAMVHAEDISCLSGQPVSYQPEVTLAPGIYLASWETGQAKGVVRFVIAR